jgi:hypothetical protein
MFKMPSPDPFLRKLRRENRAPEGEKRDFGVSLAALRPAIPQTPKKGSDFVKTVRGDFLSGRHEGRKADNVPGLQINHQKCLVEQLAYHAGIRIITADMWQRLLDQLAEGRPM